MWGIRVNGRLLTLLYEWKKHNVLAVFHNVRANDLYNIFYTGIMPDRLKYMYCWEKYPDIVLEAMKSFNTNNKDLTTIIISILGKS